MSIILCYAILYCLYYIQWGKIFDPLLILYVCPLTKKWSVYNFNGRFIWTVRDKIIQKNAFKKPLKTLVGNHRGQMFLVVVHQVCTHLRRGFVPLLFADLLQVMKVSRLTFGNSNLQLPPQMFYGIKAGDWLGHSRTLMCFFLRHSFVALAVCFGSLSFWNTRPRPIFNAHVHGPVHRPFDAVQLSCPLSRKSSQVELYCHSATCGDIQWNEMSCFTGPRCYINTDIQQWSKTL